jgi:hypothetical protein
MIYRYRLFTFVVLGVLFTTTLVSLWLPNATNAAQAKAPISAATATAVPAAVASADGGDPALPKPVDGCPYLSVTDAAALLQEDVQEQAFGNLLLAPAAGSAYPFTSALCGYVSQADQPAAPHLATRVAARAVVAAELLKGQEIKLMPLIDIVRSSRPNTNPASQRFTEERLVFEALLWGGNVSGAIEYLYALTHDQPTMHARYVSALGGSNLWVWVVLPEGHFALLIDGAFNVVAALLSQAANEQVALDVATALALQMQGNLRPSAQTPRTGACEFLSHADAMRVLSHPLPLAADQGTGFCGYGGMAQRLAEADLIPLEALPDGIASGVLAGDAAKAFLLRFGETLYQENPVKDEAIYANLKEQVASGDFEKAINAFADLAEQKRWSWTTGTGDGTHLFYRLTNEADQLAIELLARPDSLLGVIVAKLPRHRSVHWALGWLDSDDGDLLNKVPSDLLPTPTITPTPAPPTPTSTPAETPSSLSAGLPGHNSKTCFLITLEEAEAIFGRAAIVQDNMAVPGFITCIHTPAEPIAGSPDAALLTTFPFASFDSFFDQLSLTDAERKAIYEQAAKAMESHDWEPVFQKLLALSSGLPGWHGERVNSEDADNLFFSQVTTQGKQLFWFSYNREMKFQFGIAGAVPADRSDETLLAAVQEITANFWQAYKEALATPAPTSTLISTPTPTGK